jgi:signal transduction histidine kinase
LLPADPLILVYGILRYQLMVVNAWARRALAWALVVATGSVLIVALATLTMPFGGLASGWRLWAASVVALLITSLLLAPFRRLASRIVYPGADLSDGDIQQWRRSLWQPVSFAELQAAATAELSGRLRLPIRVGLGEAAHVADDGTPALVCRPSADGWCTELAGWQAAPPGARYVAQMFGSVLADAAHRLEQAEAFAARERERQKQDRLAELGALAATVAHDIRNPLNIIAMAAAMAPPPLRQEIGVQTQRIAQLATDLLDYARSWQVERRPMDLARHVQDVAASYSGIEIGNGLAIPLQVSGDDRRLRQALVNLLDNARAAADGDGRIGVDAARTADGGVALHVCDRGAGIPDEIRETLFQPFVSRRPDGTGLGLAIVAKVMEAHGGSASLTDRAGWTTCFTLTFPAPGHS